MELIFIRHGEPAWSVEGLTQSNPDLTTRGRRQAELVAARIAGDTAPTELLVSPARRARGTAVPIASATGLEPLVIDRLTEIQTPDWTGHAEEHVLEIFAEARSRPPNEWWDGLPGGESFHDFHDRVCAVMLQILEDRGVIPDDSGHPHLWNVADDSLRIAVVAHGGTNSTALSFLLGFEPTPWEWERFVLGHASIASVRAVPLAGGHVFSLRSFNDQEHLPPGMRTR